MALSIEELKNDLVFLRNKLHELNNQLNNSELSQYQITSIEYKIDNIEQQIDLVDDLIILRSRFENRTARDETEYDQQDHDISGGYTGGDSNFNDGDY